MEVKSEMTSSALVELLQLLADAAVPVWLDGGWGIDALLERQTRSHRDVDIIRQSRTSQSSRNFCRKEGS